MILARTREEREERLYPGSAHTFELGPAADAVRAEPEYVRTGRGGLTLVKGPHLRVVLMVMRAGAQLADHRAPGPITVHVLRGEIRFAMGDEVRYLRAGELLALPSREFHSVEAVHDAVFLLTIAPE